MSVAEQESATTTQEVPERTGIFTRKALNLPNTITMIRFVLALVLFGLIYLDGYWWTATILFVVAASTDFLDGYLARKYGQVTILGRILDPFVDKIIICGSFIFLIGQPASGVNAWMAIVVVGREMFVSTLRGLLEQQGLDFSANWIGKIKMAAQCGAVTGSLVFLALPAERQVDPAFVLSRDLLLWGVVLLTAYSGAAYVVRASRLLSQSAPRTGSASPGK
jgi:CDP-diacylglycerol---glycerol-3-phosphate 3-phosphatidyltransferase